MIAEIETSVLDRCLIDATPARYPLYASLDIDQDLHLVVLILDQRFEPTFRNFTHLDLLRDHTFRLDPSCLSRSVILAFRRNDPMG